MNTQETKAVEEAAEEQANKLRLYTSKYDFSRGFIAGAQFLDEFRKPGEPDKELLEALKETDKDLCVLESTMLQIEQRDHRAEGMAELVKKWRARNKQAISNYEKKQTK